MMAKSTTKTTSAKANAASKTAAPKQAPAPAPARAPTEPQGDHVDLMTPAEETKMREQATKPAAVKAAIADGKKDPIAKFGDPDADLDIAIRRANFG